MVATVSHVIDSTLLIIALSFGIGVDDIATAYIVLHGYLPVQFILIICDTHLTYFILILFIPISYGLYLLCSLRPDGQI
jgi:uncharacterized membrane protein